MATKTTKMKTLKKTILSLLILSVGLAKGQGKWDTLTWSYMYEYVSVTAFTINPTANLLWMGTTNNTGFGTVGATAFWNNDTTVFSTGLQLNRNVSCLCFYDDTLYAGTNNAAKGGGGIYKYNPSSGWQVVNGTTTLVGNCYEYNVWAMFIYKNKLYIGGGFNKVNNVAGYANLVCYDGTTWSSVARFLNPTFGSYQESIRAFAYDSTTNKLIIAENGRDASGGYDSVYEFDGTNTTVLGAISNYGADTGISALAFYKGSIYAGGKTTDVLDEYNGTSWSKVGGFSKTDGYISSLTEYHGNLFVGGEFASISSDLSQYNGTTWSTVNSWVLNSPSYISSMQVYDDSLYIGGNFSDPIPPYPLHAANIVIYGIANVTTSINNINDNFTVSVYPNPTDNIVTIGGSSEGEYRLFDISGRLIFEQKFTGNNNISLSRLVPGSYLLQVITTDGVINKKIVKQ